jgi:hypothetical protein
MRSEGSDKNPARGRTRSVRGSVRVMRTSLAPVASQWMAAGRGRPSAARIGGT